MALIDDLAAARPIALARRAMLGLADRLDAAVGPNPAYLVAAAAVFALQFALIFTHRPWIDEWQALQLALQSPTLSDLLDNLRYEGHPPLWYLVLRLIGRFCDPFWVLPVAAAAIAVPTQGAILFASPFRRAERLLLASGCLMLFEFMTISRGATLGVGLLVLALAAWRSRWCWAAIALLPMCDFLFGVLSGILLILQWRDRGRYWPGLIGWAIVGLCAAWTVRPAPDLAQALELGGLLRDTANYLLSLGILLVPLQWGPGFLPAWNGVTPLHLGGLLGALFLLFAHSEVRGERLQQVLFWAFLTLTFCFNIAVYPLHTRHVMLVAVLLILLTWRRAVHGQAPSAGFRIWLAVGAICGLAVAAFNLAVPFNTAHLAAAEIRARGLSGKPWMSFPESRAQGVSALTGIAFERPETHCLQTFVRWNFHTTLTTPDRLTAYLRGEVDRRGRFYLLSDLPLGTVPPDLLQLIVHIPPGYDQQDHYLYVAGPGRTERHPGLPLCVARQRPLAAARG